MKMVYLYLDFRKTVALCVCGLTLVAPNLKKLMF